MAFPLCCRPFRIIGPALILAACTTAGSVRPVQAETSLPDPATGPLAVVYRTRFLEAFNRAPQLRRTLDPFSPGHQQAEDGNGEPAALLFPDGNRVALFHDGAGRQVGTVRFREGRPVEAERLLLRRGTLAGRVRYQADGDQVRVERTAYFDGETVRIRHERSTNGIHFSRTHTLIPAGNDGEYLVERDKITFRPVPGSRLVALARARERAVGLPQGVLIPLRMGDRVVYLEERQRSGAPVMYLVIHPDEDTARAAVRDSLARHGGRALIFHGELPDSLRERRRNFQIGADGALYRFDPNRIFTPGGFRTQFLALGFYKNNKKADWIFQRRLLQRDGRRLARLIDEAFRMAGRAVISVHDNHSPMAWSRRIFRGEGRPGESLKAWHRPGDAYRTFFYVSEARDYEALRSAGFSVILQDNDRVRDDGSAGTWFGKSGIRYLCLEVPRDRNNRAENRQELNRMLEMTIRLLGNGERNL